MTNEQREAIEYIQKQIDYFKEQIKFIEAVDCDCYEEEYELYKNRIKQFSTVLSLLEQKDKQIDLMAEMIDKLSEYYTRYHGKNNEFCKEICIEKDIDCINCIKQYFVDLVEKE